MAQVASQAKLRIERARARWPWFDIAVTTVKRYSDDDAGTYAAALTYYIFFSIFPLTLFGATILGYLTLDPQTQRDIFDAAVDAVPLLKDALTPDGFDAIQRNREGIALIAIALALYSGSGAVVALEHALNRLSGVAQEPNFIQKRLRSLVWLAVLGAGALASVAITSGASFATEPLGGAGEALASVVGYVAGIALSAALFAIAFKVLPAKRPRWRDVVPGALVAAVGFEVLKYVGTVVMAAGKDSRNATFGTFAAAATLLTASYLVSQITLMSAELNKVLVERRLTRQSQLEDA